MDIFERHWNVYTLIQSGYALDGTFYEISYKMILFDILISKFQFSSYKAALLSCEFIGVFVIYFSELFFGWLLVS